MMMNISRNVGIEGRFPVALPLKEIKNIIGTKIMLKLKILRSISEVSDKTRKLNKFPGHTTRESTLRSIDDTSLD